MTNGTPARDPRRLAQAHSERAWPSRAAPHLQLNRVVPFWILTSAVYHHPISIDYTKMRAMLPALQQPLRLSMAARNPQLRMIAGGSRAFQTTPTGKVAASSQGRKYPPQWPDTQ